MTVSLLISPKTLLRGLQSYPVIHGCDCGTLRRRGCGFRGFLDWSFLLAWKKDAIVVLFYDRTPLSLPQGGRKRRYGYER